MNCCWHACLVTVSVMRLATASSWDLQHSRWPVAALCALEPPGVTLPAWNWEPAGVCAQGWEASRQGRQLSERGQQAEI